MLVTMDASDHDLLGLFIREQSQEAFTALVNRHLNLVFSAALRQVRSPQLAEEVCQLVFTQLASNAAKLKPDTVLTAWLYQVARHAAIDLIRREARRQTREQIAFQMSDLNQTPAEWNRIEPLLDEAMEALDDAERAAILLRYFENKSLREVGQALGASEDAAQKRVSRALERLRSFFSKRNITVGTSALAALVSAHAVQAAPAGWVGTVAAGAVVASVALSTSTTIAVTNVIVMTAMQKALIGAVTAVAVGALVMNVYQVRQASSLRGQLQSLRTQLQTQAAAVTEAEELQRERDRATNALAVAAEENAALKKNPNDVLKLRGEVGRLRQENTAIGSSSALSKVTANAEARKMLRDQQKMGMSIIYKGLAQQMKLSSEQTDKLNDLLADHIMENVGHVTVALRDKLPLDQMDNLFAAQDAALQDQIQSLLGPEGAAQYQGYTKNLLSFLTAEQFKGMLSSDGSGQAQKATQLSEAMQSAVQAALANAGLPADYQAVPILNFRNIASEQQGDRSLKLLTDIYQRASALAGSFLSPEELTKFQQFGTTAINNNRAALSLNRTMMAPISN